ncbi:MAG: hypothetical protein QM692_19550 [Thermomicrobiales bacterium]
MEDSRFDHLVRAIAGAASRRTLLGAALPVLGAGLAFLDPEGTEARKRRHKGKGASAEKKRKRKKRKKTPAATTTLPPTCTPDAPTTTCAGKCGPVTNNCFQTIECGSCVCDPPCGECMTCDVPTATCVPEPLGEPCGAGPSCANGLQHPQDTCDGAGFCQTSGDIPCQPYRCAGAVCGTACDDPFACDETAFCNASNQCEVKFGQGQPCDGAIECASGACCNNVCEQCCFNYQCGDSGLICLNNTCQSCVNSPGDCDSGTCCNSQTNGCVEDCPGVQLCDATNTCAAPCGSHADCAANSLCVEGICHACTVTENGFTSLQTAITNATDGDTLYICPGVYEPDPTDNSILIDKQLTLIGAGDGPGETRIVGPVRLEDAGLAGAPVVIRDVRVLSPFQGIDLQRGALLMTDCTVRGSGLSCRGVNNFGGALEMRRCNILNNRISNGAGIGLQNVNGSAILRNCRIEGNDGGQGAGIFTGNQATFTATLELYSTEVRGNTSSSSGAGIFNLVNTPGSSTVTVSNDSAICANSPDATQCQNIDTSRCFASCPN